MSQDVSKLKVYHKPKLEKLGHMARVTRKTGRNPDQNQPGRPKPGMGGG